MTRLRLALIYSLAALAVMPGTASAATPTVLQAGPRLGGIRAASDVYTDHAGGVDAVWGSGVDKQSLRFARRARGAKRFGKTHMLPRVAGSQSNYAAHIYEAGGELRVLFRSENNTYPTEWVARSKNHGKSWRLTKLPPIDGGPQGTGLYGFYLRENSAIAADGTIRGMYGNAGAENLYTIAPGFGSGTLLTPFEAAFLGDEWLIGEPGGALWLSGRTNGGVGYRLPSGATGTGTFPLCSNVTVPAANAMAVAHGRAVLFAATCGGMYSRTVTAAGKVGPRKRFGTSATNVRTVSAAFAHGRYRVAWVGADGDIQEASSKTGSSWSVLPGAIPASKSDPAGTTQLYLDTRSGSQVIWGNAAAPPAFGYATAGSGARVRTPRASERGIAHPKRGHLGTLSIVGPSRISLKALEKGRGVSIRVLASAPDTIIVTPYAHLPGSSFPIGTTLTVHLRAGHPKVLRFKPDPNYVSTYFRKGEKVEYDVQSRNGTLALGGARLVG